MHPKFHAKKRKKKSANLVVKSALFVGGGISRARTYDLHDVN